MFSFIPLVFSCETFFVSQENQIKESVFFNHYLSRGVSFTKDQFFSSIPQDRKELKVGDSFCLPFSFPTQAKVLDGESLWSIWQRYGCERGFSFDRFLKSQLERKGLFSESVDVWDYNSRYGDQINSLFSTVDVKQKFDDEYISSIDSRNSYVVGLISGVGDGVFETIDSSLSISSELQLMLENFGNFHVVVIGKDVLEGSSISVSSISDMIYNKNYLLKVADEKDNENILVVIIPNQAVLVSSKNPSFSKEASFLGASRIEEGYDLTSVISGIFGVFLSANPQ